MPKAGRVDDEELEAEKALDSKNEVYQDSNSKEKSGMVVATYERSEPQGLPIGTPESIVTTHEDDAPAMMGVEVHPGPITAKLTCPLLLKRSMHAIPFFWK